MELIALWKKHVNVVASNISLKDFIQVIMASIIGIDVVIRYDC